MMFDDQLLESFMETFYGFGNFGGKYWFVGMEEGGGNTFEEVAGRLAGWESRGRNELEGLGERSRVQRTWGMLIHILLAAEGDEATLEKVRAYQRTQWGKRDGDNCLVERLPLPSPSTSKWLYGEHSALPQLHTRAAYGEHYAKRRATHLKEKVEEYKPAAVIFYGFAYRYWWGLIAGVELTQISIGTDVCYLGSNSHTVFAVAKHPASTGITTNYFREVGAAVALGLGSEPHLGE